MKNLYQQRINSKKVTGFRRVTWITGDLNTVMDLKRSLDISGLIFNTE